MKIDLTKSDNLNMFRRAWKEHVVPNHGIGPAGTDRTYTIKESAEVWHKCFGCTMMYYTTSDGNSGFVTAEFDNDEDATAFLLKWA